MHTCSGAVPPVQRILCCGRTPNICACFAPPPRQEGFRLRSRKVPLGIADANVPLSNTEFWLPKHPIRQARKDHTLRIYAPEPFRLHWSHNREAPWRDQDSRPTDAIGGEYADLRPTDFDAARRNSNFLLGKDADAWEDACNYQVEDLLRKIYAKSLRKKQELSWSQALQQGWDVRRYRAFARDGACIGPLNWPISDTEGLSRRRRA